MTPARFDLLYERYLAGALSPAEERLLRELLEDSEWKRRWRDLSDLDGMLLGEFGVEPAAVESRPDSTSRTRFSRTIRTAGTVRRAGGRRPATAIAAAGAALALAGIALAVALGKGSRPEPAGPASETAASTPPEDTRRAPPERDPWKEAFPGPRRRLTSPAESPATETSSGSAPPPALTAAPATPANEPDPLPENPAAAEARARLTISWLARVADVKGDGWSSMPASESTRLAAGSEVGVGQILRTAPGDGGATLVQYDGTRLRMGPDTEITYDGGGARLLLARGLLEIDAAKRNPEMPWLLATAHAEIRIVGTRFSVRCDRRRTRLEISEGAVDFKDLRSGTASRVEAGQSSSAPPPPTGEAARVQEALVRAIDYLARANTNHLHAAEFWFLGPNCDELVLRALLHAGTPESEPAFRALLDRVLRAPLERTYKVAAQAAVLEELDRVQYQTRIGQCAQFLVDNQGANGQWSYGVQSLAAQEVPRRGAGGRITVKRTRDGPPAGDNSNSLFAAMGLHACANAGIVLPRETLTRAVQAWRDTQHSPTGRDPFWGPIRGWCYGAKDSHPAYGAMTAGAVASLASYDTLLQTDLRGDAALKAGLAWLAARFTAAEHPGPPEARAAGTKEFHLYYLSTVERAGSLLGLEAFGKDPWYAQGVRVLLDSQKADGSWQNEAEWSRPVWDTCFAIYFLARVTRPLPAAEAPKRGR